MLNINGSNLFIIKQKFFMIKKFKSRDVTLPTKVRLVKAMVFPVVITFLPRSKSLLISWLQSPPAVILEPKKIKSDTVSTVSPSTSHEVMGPDATQP